MPYGVYLNSQVIAECVVPLRLESNQPEFSSDTLSLKRFVSRRPAQRWEFSTRLTPLINTANQLFALFVTSGSAVPMQFLMPQNIGVIRNRTGTGQGTATGTINATSVTAVYTGLIPTGALIRFANHNKVYMATADRSGNGSLSIYPALRSAVPGGTIMYCGDNVIMNVWSEPENIKGMQFDDGILMDLGTLRFVEQL